MSIPDAIVQFPLIPLIPFMKGLSNHNNHEVEHCRDVAYPPLTAYGNPLG
jgi:hypothetical protein